MNQHTKDTLMTLILDVASRKFEEGINFELFQQNSSLKREQSLNFAEQESQKALLELQNFIQGI